MDSRPDPVAGAAAAPSTASALAAQVEVVRSERVARRVLADLPAARRAEWDALRQAAGPGAADQTLETWAVAEWSKRLELRPLRDSGVLELGFRAETADLAAAMANAWVAASAAVALDLRVEPARQYAEYFERQSKAAREDLMAAQQRLSAFQRTHGLVLSDERLDLEQMRLADLSRQLGSLQQQSLDSGSRLRQGGGQAAEGLQDVLNNPAIGQLKAELARTEAQLGQLATRLGDNHPQLTALAAQRDELRNRLEAETRRIAGGVGLSNRINQQREAETAAALGAQRERVLSLKSRRDEGQLLLREAEQAQRTYDALLQRRNQSELEGEATRAPMSLLSPAVPPAQASAPRAAVLAALALLLGALVALGGVALAELRWRRLHGEADVVDALGLPVLGRLSNMSSMSMSARGA
jgi:polysaccharide biosynthesis transport protein